MVSETNSESDTTRYKITIAPLRHLYGQRLYDVEGNVLKSKSENQDLSVWSSSLKEAFQKEGLHFMHCLYPGYRYFVTSKEQACLFYTSREYGHEDYGKTFYVYYDEDFDEDIARTNKMITYIINSDQYRPGCHHHRARSV